MKSEITLDGQLANWSTRRVSKLIVSAAIFVSCLQGLGCSQNAGDASKALVIRNVRIFNGRQVLPDHEVVVEAGLIKAIRSDGTIPDGAAVLDGTGQTLLPGLIDAHTHLPFEILMRQAAAFGVTTQLDMYSDPLAVRAAKQFLRSPNGAQAADLFAAGFGVTAPGGHGTEYGLPVPTIAGPAEAQAFIDARIADGADYIKVIYDDGAAIGRPFTNITRETLEAAIKGAHQRAKLAVVHIMALDAARDSAEAGADGLVHTFADRVPDPDVVALIAARGTFVVPTLTLFESMMNRKPDPTLAPDDQLISNLGRSSLTRNPDPVRGPATNEAAQESVRALHAARVTILAGTDAGNPGTTHGASLHHELELLVRAGLSPLEALQAATSLVAEKFRLRDRGLIAPGLRADLLLVRGDPTTNISTTRQIAGVWKGGVQVNRGAYGSLLELQTAFYERAAAGRASEAITRYDAYKSRHGNEHPIDEQTINLMGYRLLRSKQVGEAIRIFQLVVREYPDSWNAYDSLGDGYMARGDRTLAIDNYERSLALNPQNQNAQHKLQKLRARAE